MKRPVLLLGEEQKAQDPTGLHGDIIMVMQCMNSLYQSISNKTWDTIF